MTTGQNGFGSSLTRRTALLGLAAAGAATLGGFACPGIARAATPVRGGNLRFGLAGANTTDSLDPGLAWDDFMMLLTNGGLRNNLVELAPDGSPVPELAESWEASPDARVWLFRLRRGVEFHNGQSFTANDALASIRHHIRDDATSLSKSVLSQISEVVAEDSHTLRITLAQGNADLAILLSDYHLGMMPALPDGSVDWQSGIGTGGYKLEMFEPGVKAMGTRFANYWKTGRAHADSVELIAINDASARQAALMSGAVDVINRVDLKTLEFFSRAPNVRIDEVQGYQHATLPMRVTSAPFSDVNVRLALKHAVNREQWVKAILQGHGSVGNDHPISRTQKYFNADLEQRSHDPDKARYHLKQAGLDRLAVDLSTSDAAFAGAVDAAVLMQNSAAEVGIDITAIREPSDGYWSSVWAKKPFCACYWAGRPTADGIFSLIYAKGASFGDTDWDNARFNSILTEARGTLDEALRAEMYGELQAIVRDDAGTIVPMFMNFVNGTSDRVGMPEARNAELALDGMKALERWWIS